MSRLRTLLPAAGILLLAMSTCAAEGGWLGRPLVDLLAAAQADGITVVFNTQLVPETLVVEVEPRAASGTARLQEVLAAHGLALAPAGNGVYAVTRIPAAPERVAAPRPPAPRSMEEVVVTTSRYRVDDEVVASHAVVTSDAIATLPRLGEETLKVVQRLPGVASNGIAGLAPVRGGEPDETLIRLDGLTLYEPFHLKHFLSPVSLLDAAFVGGLDFHSGGFPAVYGDRMSAVIDARSALPRSSREYGLALSLFHVSAQAGGSSADGEDGWLASLRQSNLGRLSSALGSDFGNPKYFDGFVRIDHRLGERTRLSVSALGSRDEIDLNWERAGETSSAGYRNAYVWTTLDHDWTSALSGRFVVSFTDVNNLRQGEVDDPGRLSGHVVDERNFHVAGLAADLRWQGPYGLHRWGMDAKYLQADSRYVGSAEFGELPLFPALSGSVVSRESHVTPEGWQYAAYWSGRFELLDNLAAEAGLRLEDATYVGPEHALELMPRLGILYEVGTGSRLRFGWGQYMQAQRINELQLEDGVAAFGPAQRSRHAIVGFEYAWSTALGLRLEAYRKDYSRLKPRYENLFDPVVLLPELQPDRILVAPSSATARGVELSLTWRPGGAFSGWFSYVWSEVADRIGEEDVRRAWDQEHALGAGLRWAQGAWDVTLADTWHSGWPTTPVVRSADGTWQPGARNASRRGSFHSLDFKASRRFALPRGELEAFVEVTNLLNDRNPCCVDHRVTGDGRGELVSDVNAWLGIVPSAGVAWRFAR